MKRSELHFGQTIFLRTLNKTDSMFGSDEDLKNMVGQYIKIYDFDVSYNNIIRIIHSWTGTYYSIHTDDISLTEPPLPKMDEEKIIKVQHGEKVTFDEKQLFI